MSRATNCELPAAPVRGTKLTPDCRSLETSCCSSEERKTQLRGFIDRIEVKPLEGEALVFRQKNSRLHPLQGRMEPGCLLRW